MIRTRPLRAAGIAVVAALAAAHARAGEPAKGPERILSYDSKITVQPDASLTVEETIQVVARGRKIRQGIYRDFPTIYRTGLGMQRRVPFKVVKVLRDGKPEPYHRKNLSNGVRVYAGKKGKFLKHGLYTYTFVYRTSRQLGFFEKHDELYWNVTGLGWDFAIEKATATVVLPDNVPREEIRLEAYTGPKGAKGKDYRARLDDSGRPYFETTRGLGPHQGITVVTMWPKGFVKEPPKKGAVATLFDEEHMPFGVALLGILVVLGYYIVTWVMVGRDPEKGTIIPMFEAPKGMSPAACRYVLEMGFDNKCLTSAVLDMAVKGFLSITEEDKVYTLERETEDRSRLSKDEKGLASSAFKGHKKLTLEQENHSRVAEAITGLKSSLSCSYEKVLFFANSGYLGVGLLLSLATVVVTGYLLAVSGSEEVILISGFAAIWNGFVFGMFYHLSKSWWALIRGALPAMQAVATAFRTLFMLPFLGVGLFVLYLAANQGGHALVGVVIGLIVMGIIFHHFLKAPTRTGRRVMDGIEGLRMYLKTAEESELKGVTPEKTPEIFERFLPYAVALDCENDWAEKFTHVLEAAAADTGESYSPSWYRGAAWGTLGGTAFASSFASSFSSAASAASTAPGSSSGGGGGGSSGGGGGGGGGGGW